MNHLLADTSIWADHFRSPNPLLIQLLSDHRIRMHPYVLGELRMGNLPRRPDTVDFLNTILRAPAVDDDEVLSFVEAGRMFGTGLSWIDAHLLTSVVVSPGLALWTRDRRLNDAALRHGKSAALFH